MSRATDLKVGENHFLDRIEIPTVVRRGLVIPCQPAGIRMKSQDRCRVERVEVAGSDLAQVIGRGVGRAKINELELGVVGETIPRGAAQFELRIARGVPTLGGRR